MGKILILANSSSGLYGFRGELIQELVKKNTVYTSLPDQTNNKELAKEGCQIIKTAFERRGMNPIKDFKLICTYIKMVRQIKPDAVLTYTIKPNLYGGLACRMLKVPYIVNITGLGTTLQSNTLLSRMLLILYRVSTKKAQCIFFQNKENLTFLQTKKIALKRAELLPGSGVNLTKYFYHSYPDESESIRFLAVLRIMKDKGIEEYLTAVEYIKTQYPKTDFYLAGEYEEETKELYMPWINRLEEKGILHYLGYCNNMSDVMAECHIIVHPSYHEGLSNVLLEAASCGRPVLASDVPGCREALQAGISGEQFESHSSDALIGAIEVMLSYSSEEREEMGKQGRKYIEDHFDRNIVIEKYLNELKKIHC